MFWQNGYHAVSTDMICRAAGVRKSSLYHAFPSKADVLAAALAGVWGGNWREISAIYAQGAPIARRFREHLDWFADCQRRLRETFGIVPGTFDMALGVAVPETVAAAMRSHQNEHAARIRCAIAELAGLDEQGPRASWLADIVGDIVTGSTIKARLRNDLAPLEALPDTIFELLRATSAADRPPSP